MKILSIFRVFCWFSSFVLVEFISFAYGAPAVVLAALGDMLRGSVSYRPVLMLMSLSESAEIHRGPFSSVGSTHN